MRSKLKKWSNAASWRAAWNRIEWCRWRKQARPLATPMGPALVGWPCHRMTKTSAESGWGGDVLCFKQLTISLTIFSYDSGKLQLTE
jgi:hypothetical protein